MLTISQIIYKSFREEQALSAWEQKELESWLEIKENRELYNEFSTAELLREKIKIFIDHDSDRLRNKFLEKLTHARNMANEK